MKPIPLLIAIFGFATFASAETSSWTSLTKIDDKIRLKPGEIALVVSVSEPIYLGIEQPQRSARGVRLRPSRIERRRCSFSQGSDYVNRRTQTVTWRKPFPISGPCTIRLGTPALVTLRIIDTNPG